MDARMDLEQILGLQTGDAHILRNAGGRATEDMIRSLAISSLLLGTREFMVIHHTRCGMASHSNEEIRAVVRERTGGDASRIDFLPFTDLEESVREDVRALRESPLLPRAVDVRGFVYDVVTGRVTEVDAA
jgi:carbonic anhydrase